MPLLAPLKDQTGGPGQPPGDVPRHNFGLLTGPATGGYQAPVEWSTTTAPTITWRLTDSHQAQFAVNAGLFDLAGNTPDRGLDGLATDLHVLWAGQPLFRGRLGPVSEQLDDNGHLVTFTADSYRALLARRFFSSAGVLSWSNLDVGTIVAQMVRQTQQHTGGDLGIVNGQGIPFGQTTSIDVQAGDIVSDSIDLLAYVDGPGGFDWDIVPRDQAVQGLDLWPGGRGRDQGVFLQFGDTLTDMPWQRSTDTSTFANSIRMTGGSNAQGNSPNPVELDATNLASRPEGLWQAVFQSSPSGQTLLEAYALLQLRTSSAVVPSYTIPLRPGAWDGPGHIWLGDIVHVRPGSGRLTAVEDLAVLEMTANLTGDGDQITLTLGTPRPDIGRALKQILRELRRARVHVQVGRHVIKRV